MNREILLEYIQARIEAYNDYLKAIKESKRSLHFDIQISITHGIINELENLKNWAKNYE